MKSIAEGTLTRTTGFSVVIALLLSTFVLMGTATSATASDTLSGLAMSPKLSADPPPPPPIIDPPSVDPPKHQMPVHAGDVPSHESGGSSGALIDGSDHSGISQGSNTGRTAAGGDGSRRSGSGDGFYDTTTVTTSSHFAPCADKMINTGDGGTVRLMPTHKTTTVTYRTYEAGSAISILRNNGEAGSYLLSTGPMVCHYPAAWTDTRVVCITNIALAVNKVQPNQKNVFSRSVNTAFGNNRTLANCLNSGGIISTEVTLSEFGRYKGTGEGTGVACFHRNYYTPDAETGIIPPDTLVNCGGPFQVSYMESFAQIDCTGAYGYYRNNSPSWTATECSDQHSTTPTYQCVVGDTVKVNGTSRKQTQLKRDGSVNTLQWDAPALAGSNIRSFNFTGTTLKRSGSPWIAGKGSTGNLVEVGTSKTGSRASLLAKDAGTNRQSGAVNTWYGRWYAASNTGEATKLTPVYDFHAVVRSTTYVITAINLETGALTFAPRHYDFSTSGQCTGPTLSVETLKVVNDVG